MTAALALLQSATATVTAPGAGDLLAERMTLGLFGLVAVVLLIAARTLVAVRDEVRDVRGILVGPDGQNGLRGQVQETRKSVHDIRNDLQAHETTLAVQAAQLAALERGAA